MTATTQLKRLALSGIAILSPVLAYAGLALAGAAIPVNPASIPPVAGTPIWLCSNGVHTDILLAARGGPIDWLSILPPKVFRRPPAPDPALSFGWGDRDFYLGTPYWSDFRLTTALKAISGDDQTVVHIEARRLGDGDPACHRVLLTPPQLVRLDAYIRGAMAGDASGKPIPIDAAGYGDHDGFVAATGHYSLVLTCNEWVRRGLQAAGLRTALWSPFPFGLTWRATRG